VPGAELAAEIAAKALQHLQRTIAACRERQDFSIGRNVKDIIRAARRISIDNLKDDAIQ